jgi:hypothetical protein
MTMAPCAVVVLFVVKNKNDNNIAIIVFFTIGKEK